MEAVDSLPAGQNPEVTAPAVIPERLQDSVEADGQKPGQIVIKESFCLPWVEDPATFDPAQAGWEQAAGNVLAKIQEMLASPEVVLTSDGLTPKQAAAKEQENLLIQASARAAKLAEDLAAARGNIDQTATVAPPGPAPVEILQPSADEEISQLVEAPPPSISVPAEEALAVPLAPAPEPATPMPETGGGGLDQLLEQVPAEMKEEIEKRLAEFGENFDEEKFAKEHQEEYELINQVISEAGDPARAAEAAGKIKARLDMLDSQEDGDKKKKDFLVNLFGIYKRRFDQETDPEKKEEVKKSMLGLRQELGGLGVGALGGLLNLMIEAIVGEIQEQLK